MSTLENVGNFLWSCCKFTNRKLQQFVADEKACNKKLETFLKDVDSCSIRNQGSTAGKNSWIYFGKYKPVYTGPFAPVPEKKNNDKVINIIIK